MYKNQLQYFYALHYLILIYKSLHEASVQHAIRTITIFFLFMLFVFLNSFCKDIAYFAKKKKTIFYQPTNKKSDFNQIKTTFQ